MLNVCYGLHKTRLGIGYEYNKQVSIKSRMIILGYNHKNSQILEGGLHTIASSLVDNEVSI